MNYYLEGRKGQEGSSVVKWVCLKWKGEVGSVYTGSMKGLFGEALFDTGRITNDMFSPFVFSPVCLSFYLPLKSPIAISCAISLSLTSLHSFYLNICLLLPSFCFSLYKAASVEKRPFSFGGFVGPRLLIVCLQWPLYPAIKPGKKPIGETWKLTLIWKAILAKELETIILSMKWLEIWPLLEHKWFDLQNVLTLVALRWSELDPHWSVHLTPMTLLFPAIIPWMSPENNTLY